MRVRIPLRPTVHTRKEERCCMKTVRFPVSLTVQYMLIPLISTEASLSKSINKADIPT